MIKSLKIESVYLYPIKYLDFLITFFAISVKYSDDPGPTPTRNNFFPTILFSIKTISSNDIICIFYFLSLAKGSFLVKSQKTTKTKVNTNSMTFCIKLLLDSNPHVETVRDLLRDISPNPLQ